MGGYHTINGILYSNCLLRLRTKLLTGFQIDVRVWFSALDLIQPDEETKKKADRISNDIFELTELFED